MTPETQSTEIALLRGEVMTALARIEGDVRLVLQQIEQATRRTDDLDRKVDRLDVRVDALEATRPTRDELEQQAAKRTQRAYALAGLAMTGTGILSGAAVAIATALIK